MGRPRHPRDLTQRPAVNFQGLSSASSWNFVDKGRALSVPVTGPFSCNHAASAVEACTEGLGFGQFLSYQVEALVAEKRLKIVLAKFEQAPLPIHVVFAHARLMSPRIRVLVDWMKEHLQTPTRP